MNATDKFPIEGGCLPIVGGCACGVVRYRLMSKPLFVHCCHCTWCQRESGAAFAINAMIESDRVEVIKGAPQAVPTPSQSGRGQTFLRCPECQIALWSHYAGAGKTISFVRVGTLDAPDCVPPEIHIYTASKQSWVILPENIPAYKGYYDWKKEWPEEAKARRAAMKK